MSELPLKKKIESTVLTKKASIVAQYILDNQSTVAYMPASKLAHELGVSDSTIHRLTKQLGYENFGDMQKELQEAIIRQLESKNIAYRSPGETLMEKFNGQSISAADIIHESVLLANDNINAVYRDISDETVENASNALLNARRVYVIGLWSAAALADMFAYKFIYCNDNIFTITSPGPECMAKAMSIQKHDCVILYSLNRPVNALETYIRFARKKEATIILITKKETDPLTPFADYCFVGDTEGVGFSSLMAPLLITEILLSSAVSKVWKKRQKFTTNLNLLLEETGYYK